MKKSKVRSITIFGRRWFAKTYGNTYFTAEIHVNGVCIHKLDQEYGYGNQYEWAAMAWLDANGYTNCERFPESGGRESGFRYCERKKIAYAVSVADVARERDL